MAMLHSRIRRVIYGFSDKTFGGLGGKYEVHVEKSLNHHFAVYSGLLQDECQLEYQQSSI